MRYRKKPVVIDAVQFTGNNASQIWEELGRTNIYGWNWDPAERTYEKLVIDTREGRMDCPVGWWIVRGVEGELYPVKTSVFEATYEAVDLGA